MLKGTAQSVSADCMHTALRPVWQVKHNRWAIEILALQHVSRQQFWPQIFKIRFGTFVDQLDDGMIDTRPDFDRKFRTKTEHGSNRLQSMVSCCHDFPRILPALLILLVFGPQGNVTANESCR